MSESSEFLVLYLQGRQRWPQLDIPQTVFVRHLQHHLDQATRPAQFLSALHVEDFYLACACAYSVPGALETFEKVHLSQVSSYLSHFDQTPAFIDEVCQTLRAKLFVSTEDRPAKIAEYSGTGMLASWVRIVTVRLATDLVRVKQPLPLEESHFQLRGEGSDPESTCIKQQFRGAVESAFKGAMRTLTPEQRNLLRMYYLNDLTMREIAQVSGVSPASVMRRLEALYETVVAEMRRRLTEECKLDLRELESLIGVVQSQMDLSLGRLLKSDTGRLQRITN